LSIWKVLVSVTDVNTTPQNQHTGPGMSPDEARAALEQASRTSAVAPRDRTVYAVGTALFGVVLGAFVPLTRALDMTTDRAT